MMRSAQLLGLTIVLGMAIAVPGISFAQEAPAITQVYHHGASAITWMRFLAEAKNNEKIFARLGIDAKRTYRQATLAGEEMGQIALTIDYANLESFAVAQGKLASDAEWQKYIDKLNDRRNRR